MDDLTLLLEHLSEKDHALLIRYVGLLQSRRIFHHAEHPTEDHPCHPQDSYYPLLSWETAQPVSPFFGANIYGNDRHRYNTASSLPGSTMEVPRYRNNPFRTLLFSLYHGGSSDFYDLGFYTLLRNLPTYTNAGGRCSWPDEIHSVSMGSMTLRYLKPEVYTPFRVEDKRPIHEQFGEIMTDTLCTHLGVHACKHRVDWDCSICATAAKAPFKGMHNFTLRPHKLATTFLGNHCLMDYIQYDLNNAAITSPLMLRGEEIGLWQMCLDTALILDRLMSLGLMDFSRVNSEGTAPFILIHQRARTAENLAFLGQTPPFRMSPVSFQSWEKLARACFTGVDGIDSDSERDSHVYHAVNTLYSASWNSNWQNVIRLHALYPKQMQWDQFVYRLEQSCVQKPASHLLSATEPVSLATKMRRRLVESPLWKSLNGTCDWHSSPMFRGVLATEQPTPHPATGPENLVSNLIADCDWLALVYALYHNVDFRSVINALDYTPTVWSHDDYKVWESTLSRVHIEIESDQADVSVVTKEGKVLWDLLMQFGALEFDNSSVSTPVRSVNTFYVPQEYNSTSSNLIPMQQGLFHRAILHYNETVMSAFTPAYYQSRSNRDTLKEVNDTFFDDVSLIAHDLPDTVTDFLIRQPFVPGTLAKVSFVRGLSSKRLTVFCDAFCMELDESFSLCFHQLLNEHGAFFNRCVEPLRSFINERLYVFSSSSNQEDYLQIPPFVRTSLIRCQLVEFLKGLKTDSKTPGGWKLRRELAICNRLEVIPVACSTVLCLSDGKVAKSVDRNMIWRRLINYYHIVGKLPHSNYSAALPVPFRDTVEAINPPFHRDDTIDGPYARIIPPLHKLQNLIIEAQQARLQSKSLMDGAALRLMSLNYCPITNGSRGALNTPCRESALVSYGYRPRALHISLCQLEDRSGMDYKLDYLRRTMVMLLGDWGNHPCGVLTPGAIVHTPTFIIAGTRRVWNLNVWPKGPKRTLESTEEIELRSSSSAISSEEESLESPLKKARYSKSASSSSVDNELIEEVSESSIEDSELIEEVSDSSEDTL
jgi:hypothetical protein